MPYLLDTQVVSFFLQARREADLVAAAAAMPCAIADEVRVNSPTIRPAAGSSSSGYRRATSRSSRFP